MMNLVNVYTVSAAYNTPFEKVKKGNSPKLY